MDDLEKANDVIRKLEARNAELAAALEGLLNLVTAEVPNIPGAVQRAHAALAKKEPANG